jgi:ribosome-associated heat shock protein Hsp15
MEAVRIDKWLWFARFCKSRSLAQHLIESGEIALNGRPVLKTSTSVKPGDELVLPKGRGWWRVRVVAVGSRRGPFCEARTLYEDLSDVSPPATDRPETAYPLTVGMGDD